jgi:hypothetical protein
MPAAARRSKPKAYEKGIREGMAMAKRSRGNKPTEEEEMDMGMKPGHSRKRRKPAADGYGMKKPMDGDMYGKKPMDAECGCGKKKGRKCDGSCGSMRKRSDSLTPQEYLTACEMGIQDRGATYIRARLDVAEARNDLKCGKGAISEGEKCTKGPATKVRPKKPKSGLRQAASSVAVLGGLALQAGATGVGLGKSLSGDTAGAARAFQIAGAGQALTAAGARGMGLKKESKQILANAALSVGAATMLREAKTGEIASGLRRGRTALQTRRRRRSLERAFRKPSAIRPSRRDSIWAEGFEP